jgi:hypothetical protein
MATEGAQRLRRRLLLRSDLCAILQYRGLQDVSSDLLAGDRAVPLLNDLLVCAVFDQYEQRAIDLFA